MQRLIGIHPRPFSRIAAMRSIPRVFADSSLRGSVIGNNLRKNLRGSAFRLGISRKRHEHRG
jgi:hypothetical protein